MTKFFKKFKKPYFCPFFVHLPNVWGKKSFPENPTLSSLTLYSFLAPCQNLEKLMTPRKCPDRWNGGQNNRQTLFYRTLLGNTVGPIKQLQKYINHIYNICIKFKNKCLIFETYIHNIKLVNRHWLKNR